MAKAQGQHGWPEHHTRSVHSGHGCRTGVAGPGRWSGTGRRGAGGSLGWGCPWARTQSCLDFAIWFWAPVTDCRPGFKILGDNPWLMLCAQLPTSEPTLGSRHEGVVRGERGAQAPAGYHVPAPVRTRMLGKGGQTIITASPALLTTPCPSTPGLASASQPGHRQGHGPRCSHQSENLSPISAHTVLGSAGVCRPHRDEGTSPWRLPRLGRARHSGTAPSRMRVPGPTDTSSLPSKAQPFVLHSCPGWEVDLAQPAGPRAAGCPWETQEGCPEEEELEEGPGPDRVVEGWLGSTWATHWAPMRPCVGQVRRGGAPCGRGLAFVS